LPRTSGQAPFEFSLCEDLYTLPERARGFEARLHGGFAVDGRPGGSLYYGIPGCGLMRVSPDLGRQEILRLPPDLEPFNFHSTRLVELDGERRLVLPSNDAGMVVVLDLDGQVQFRLPRPELEEYRDRDTPFKPTDVAFAADRLFVTDGYGANYVSTADLRARRWDGAFGGRTDDPGAPGRFGTAHGLSRHPDGRHLAIADRPHARFQHFGHDGHFHSSHSLPSGSKPCGIDFRQLGGRWYGLVASLDDPRPGRPAPLYVLDAESYEVVSTIRPREELGVELADHIHNAVWHEHGGQLYAVCQAWNPGHYFVLALES